MVMKNSTNSTSNAGRARSRVTKIRKAAMLKRSEVAAPIFGPVATIDSAPVAIGNSVSGSEPIVNSTPGGVRIRGRDFLTSIDAVQASLTTWYMVGGAPIIPHALTSSLLKSYAGIYSQFVVHGVAFHYITATSTSVQGDVLLMINKNAGNPILNMDSSNFLSVVLSDKNTVFGPLWKNHTAVYKPPPVIYDTDILNGEDLQHRGPGELIVFTRSSSEQTPGYIIMDYDISFRTMQVNVRALTFPISKMKYHQTAFYLNGLALTTTSEVPVVLGGSGHKLDGDVASAPPDVALGDIYKCVLLPNSATFTNATAGTLLKLPIFGDASSVVNDSFPILQGTTIYMVAFGFTSGVLYPTLAAARAQTDRFRSGVSANVSFDIPVFLSFVGNVGDRAYSQANT